MAAPPSHHFSVNRALPCCDPLLPQEVWGLVSWSNGIRSELDGFYNLWSTQQEVDGQEIASLSVKLDSLQENLNHMIDCHLLPMQDVINGLSQSVLVLMGREAGGLVPLPRGCDQWDAFAQSEGEVGFVHTSPEPIPVPGLNLQSGNDSVPSLVSVSSSSSSSVSSASTQASSFDGWILPSCVPTNYPLFSDLYCSLEEGLVALPQGELQTILKAMGAIQGSEDAHEIEGNQNVPGSF